MRHNSKRRARNAEAGELVSDGSWSGLKDFKACTSERGAVRRWRKGLAQDRAIQVRLAQARVAHLATADAQGRPHVVPVCFVHDGIRFYTPLDLKPKRVRPANLVRVRNVQANPNVALLIDEYSEDWNLLWYVLIRGEAAVLNKGKEYDKAHLLSSSLIHQFQRNKRPVNFHDA